MRNIPFDKSRLQKAEEAHYQAILSFVKKQDDAFIAQLRNDVAKVLIACNQKYDQDDENEWLRVFILAGVPLLRLFVTQKGDLQFSQFRIIYESLFCNGSDKFIDADTRYNAYTFIDNLGVRVCPYCDDEYLDVIDDKNGHKIRTLEIDHFFPKAKYPALALCFFNLVPCGQNCNGIKKEHLLGANPYEDDIESLTYLHPDLPIGINMEVVPLEECTIKFHPEVKMKTNVKELGLEERYSKHRDIAKKYLMIMQQYDESKVREMVHMGFCKNEEIAYRILYGEPLEDNGGQHLLSKLKHDLTGR